MKRARRDKVIYHGSRSKMFGFWVLSSRNRKNESGTYRIRRSFGTVEDLVTDCESSKKFCTTKLLTID